MTEVYTRDNCPYCDQAKALLTEKGIAFEEVPMTNDGVKAGLLKRVFDATATEENPEGFVPTKVPQIFLEGQYIGGFDKLKEHFDAQS
jgi:glutaredoxin